MTRSAPFDCQKNSVTFRFFDRFVAYMFTVDFQEHENDFFKTISGSSNEFLCKLELNAKRSCRIRAPRTPAERLCNYELS